MIALSIVIPIYNEQETLTNLFDRLNHELDNIRQELCSVQKLQGTVTIEILFIDDGSTDNSRQIVSSVVANNSIYRQINLSRNFGHQAAVAAGFKFARGQAIVIMDGDLQDPPELIKHLVSIWNQGFKVVYAQRRTRQAPLMINAAYKLYYKIISALSDSPVQPDSGDFSLLDRTVVDVINQLPEKERYMRGLRAWVGFRQTSVEYDRPERKTGKTKYSLAKLMTLATQGLTSTTVKPLFVSGILTIMSIVFISSICLYAILGKWIVPENRMPAGWTSLIATISIVGFGQLMSTWLLSLYIARLFREVISRPTYIVESDSLVLEHPTTPMISNRAQ